MTQARVELLADSRQVRRATDDLKRLEARGASTTNVVSNLRMAFVALGGAAVLGKAIREIASFQAALNGLAAVSGATTNQMAELEQQARLLGATSMFSAQQAAEGQRFLAQAGFGVNEILSATPGILKLATAGGLDLARAADIASNVLGGMRLEVDELNRVNDVLAATAARSNTSIEQLGQALSFAAPFAAGAGISIEEASAAIGVMSDAGIQASRAGTGLVGVIRQLSKVTTEGERVLTKYGLTTEDVNIESRGLLPVLESLRRANLSTGDAIALFGSEAGAAAQVLVQGFKGGIEGATGEADRMARQLEKGLTPAFKSLISAISESTLQLGSGGIAGALEDLTRSATGVISVWNGMGAEWAESNDVGEDMLGTIEGIADGLEFLGKAAVAVVGARLAGTIGATTVAFVQHQVAQQAVIARYAQMNGITPLAARGLMGVGAAARGASAALALVGGPIGVAVLAAAGLLVFAERSETAEDRAKRLAGEVENLAGALEGLSRAEIIEREQAALQNVFETQQRINELVERRANAELNIADPSRVTSDMREYNQVIGNNRAAIERYNQEIEALRKKQEEERGVVNEVTEARKALIAQLEENKRKAEELNSAQDVEKLREITQSLDDQIYALENGEVAYEVMRAAREANIALDSPEADGIRERIAERERLTQAIKDETQAERERNQLREVATGIISTLSIGDDPAAQAEDEMFARLSVIDNALAAEAITKEEHRQAELLAEQAYQDELTRINEEEAKKRADNEAQISSARMQAEKALQSQALGLAQSSFGAIADVIKQAKGEESAAYKIAYTAQQAAAIAMAYINTEAAAIAAMAPPPVGLGPVAGAPYAATIRGLGYASIGIMAAQTIGTLAGGRALGGQVIGGNSYMVGERGPELITMGSNGNVTPYNQLMREARTTNNDTRNTTVNISFTLPEGNADFRNRIVENRDLIYNTVAQVLDDRGMRF